MPQLTLYHTLGCHLCEEAEALVMACLVGQGLKPSDLTQTDIADDDVLLERYGVLIPVLREQTSGRELHWPFGEKDIHRFIQDFGGT
jgi:hypothetical protein